MLPLSLEEFMMWLPDTSAETRKLEGKLGALVNLVTQLAANRKPAVRVCRIRSSNDHHTSLEGKLDTLVNLVTQLAANQKHASAGRACDIRSSNDHHISVFPSSQQSGISARIVVIVIRGVHDMAADTSAETRKLEGKLDALVNLWMSILRLMLQTPIADHHNSRDKALDREDGPQLLALEGKPGALVNLVTQLAANRKPLCKSLKGSVLPMTTILVSVLLCVSGVLRIRNLPLLEEFARSVLPMTTILVSFLLRSNLEWMSILRLMLQTPIADHHSSRDKALDREDGSQLLALEGKLDALVSLVTKLAANQKSASVARVCDICSSNDHHTSVCPSSQ
ncbi:hypothetical protein Fmac_032886 [Flemingia macrophylla]|uniref:Uncharacterized protein n=1 Tax=Flemingia macrophylla TaxID=520843 RepID=A0ABD1L7L5_9FABA